MKKIFSLILISLCILVSCSNNNPYNAFDIYNNFPDELNYYTMNSFVNYDNSTTKEDFGKEETKYTLKISAADKYIFKNLSDHIHIRYIEDGYLYHIYENTADNTKIYTKIAVDAKIDDYYPSKHLLTNIENSLDIEREKEIVKSYAEAVAYGKNWNGITKRTVEYKNNLTYGYFEFSDDTYRRKTEVILSKDLIIEDYTIRSDLVVDYSKHSYNQPFEREKINLSEYTFITNDSWNFKVSTLKPIIQE